jgi:transcriptional regulator with XRE-family HTH domain
MKFDNLPETEAGHLPVGRQHLDQFIGRRVAALRARQAYTRGELASRTGIPEADLFDFEFGLREIPAPIIYTLSRVLQVPMRCFFDHRRGAAQ